MTCILRPWQSPLALLLAMSVFHCWGCTKEPQGGPRVRTVPIRGKVLVDGKPLKGVHVIFKRGSQQGLSFPVPEPSADTDENGDLTRVSTYLSNDGGAPGEYMLLFSHSERTDPITGQPVGDIFHGKYMTLNPDFKVTIPEGGNEPFDIGKYELTTK